MFIRTYDRETIDARDEWEVTGNKATLKNGTADEGLSLATPSEEFTAQGDTSGDFENPGVSIEFVNNAWQNKVVAGTDLTTPTDPVSFPFGQGGQNPANTIDNSLGSFSNQNPGGPLTLRIDLGTAEIVALYRHLSYNGGNEFNPTQVVIEGSNDPTGTAGYISIATIDTTELFDDNGVFHDFIFTNNTPYRWWQMTYTNTNSGAGGRSIINEIELATFGFPTVNNSVTAVLPFTGSKSFSPDSIIITDENDVEIIGPGKLNLAFEINGNGFSSPEDLEQFKARDTSEFQSASVLKIEIQPVGDQKFKTCSISTANASFELTKQGDFFSRISGQIVAQMLSGTLHARSINLSGATSIQSAEESNGTLISNSTQFEPVSAGVNLELDFPIRNVTPGGVPATTDNTIETKFPSLPAPIDIAPATFKAFDENGSLITGASKVNVAFQNITGGDLNFNSLEDITAITRPNLIGTTEFQIQVQPVGFTQISKVTVETIAGEIIGSTSGQMTFKQGGVQFGTISILGIDFPGVVTEWIEDPDNLGFSLHAYENNRIITYSGNLYRNKSGGTITAGTADPVTNTTDWELV